jgi:phage/plasmid-like protein (TIGR03299 family)
VFNPAQVKAQLGIASASWHAFIEQSRKLAETDVEKVQAVEWLARVFGDAEKTAAEQDASATRTMQRVLDLFNGAGRGSDLPTAAGTAWGLVNAATEYLDHHRNERSPGNRLDRAWFGDGAVLKQRAWDEALALVTV